MTDLRAARPLATIVVLTPLWVPPVWAPASARYPLEDYRAVARAVVGEKSATGDTRMRVIEGPALIDHDAAGFDEVAVHPNDAGFAQMADRLRAALAIRA